MSGPAIKAPRSDLFNVRPDSDTVVIRMITDPNRPEFDERALDPIDENLIADIMARGQHTPATGYKSGKDEEGRDIVTLMFGRQRWKAVSEIWNRFRAEGLDLSLAPSFRIYIQVPKNDAVKRELRISENRHRKPLEGLALAREVQEYLNIVGDSDESREHARVLFNFVSLDAMKHNLALLDTTPAVQEQLAAGTLSPTGALQLSRQPAEVQNAVAEKIAAGAGAEDQDDDQGDDDPDSDHRDLDDLEKDEREASMSSEKQTKPKPVSVSEVKEMIRDTTGQASYAMVSLKQVEKEIDKKEKQREAALKRLEECPHNEFGGASQKTVEAACRLEGINGYLAALRWARGETSISPSEGATNDKASAAWEALREAIVSAAWPVILRPSDFPALKHAWDKDVTPEERSKIFEEQKERSDKMASSHLLVVAGETVAWRDMHSNKTFSIKIDVSSKWFIRLMDPFGDPSKLVRDFGAHGWLRDGSKVAGVQVWKTSFAPLSKSKTTICISDDQVAKWVPGTSLEIIESTEKTVRRIVADNSPQHSASDIMRELRFGSPWFDEDVEGPDLKETNWNRDSIRDELEEELGIQIPDEDCTWPTVGELIDYVEARVKQVAEAGAAATAPTESDETEEMGGAA